jgi:hypothetical protein
MQLTSSALWRASSTIISGSLKNIFSTSADVMLFDALAAIAAVAAVAFVVEPPEKIQGI